MAFTLKPKSSMVKAIKSKAGRKNLLKAVPNKKAYDKLSDENKKGFDIAAKKAGLPTKSNSGLKQKKAAEGDDGYGAKGFMNPPYRGPKGKGPRASRKDLSYHGYKPKEKNFNTKVMKDGTPKTHGAGDTGNWQPHQFRKK